MPTGRRIRQSRRTEKREAERSQGRRMAWLKRQVLGDLAPVKAVQEECHALYPQAQPCGECAHSGRACVLDPEGGGSTRGCPRHAPK